MVDRVKSGATRRSIKKLFPMGPIMSRGCNNPLTLHSVDENVFARVWSLVAETMVANGELSRNTKEKIADLVSKKNECPICVGIHTMMIEAMDGEGEREQYQEQALGYASMLFTATRMRTPVNSNEEPDVSLLSEAAKAEIALVVLLFSHMNRVVSALLGQELTPGLFSVPRNAAGTGEGSWFGDLINGMMKPFLSEELKEEHPIGCTDYLFKSDRADLNDQLPWHLQGSVEAGPSRAHAVARLIEWEDYFYEKRLKSAEILSEDVLDCLSGPDSAPPAFHMRFRGPEKVLTWANNSIFKRIDKLAVDEPQKTLARVLVLTSFAPQAVLRSKHWKQLVKSRGQRMARSILIWWSLHVTLKHAKGLARKRGLTIE